MSRHALGSTCVACLALLACDGQDKAPPKKRTDAVAATASSSVAKTPASATAAATASAAANKPPRDPCQGQDERDAPEGLSLTKASEGATKLPELEYGKGRWVWVNVWAAWCEPCKKEMPMLLEWRDKLERAGVKIDLAFVSIDDDERELERFLGSQPKTGVRASYWLKGEEAQESWFESVGYDDTPTLPIHAFVNPGGKTACVVDGAVEDSDYAALAKLFGGSS
jgi:thiol-disulfide isomerase/thioredoxin